MNAVASPTTTIAVLAQFERDTRRLLTFAEMVQRSFLLTIAYVAAAAAARFAMDRMRSFEVASDERLRELSDEELGRYRELLTRSSSLLRDLLRVIETGRSRGITFREVDELESLAREKLAIADEGFHCVLDIIDERDLVIDEDGPTIPWDEMKTRVGWN